ncbi:MAG: DHH family phosphoesterase, partial [Candidatus Bathyarchaeota archaeon]|nr:DHH family phosphoesterase [Candidatus Bathyarchaeota archaeon]
MVKVSPNSIFSSMQEAIKSLLSFKVDRIQVIHHDDADGLCAASIVRSILEKRGFTVKTICIEKLFPEVIGKLHSSEGKVYIYADIGSAHASKISAVNKSKNLTIILDHHDFEESTDPLVYNLNPEVYGISGEEEASASTVAYFFAKEMDSLNTSLAHLAVIGAAEIPGPIKGLNL